MLILQSTELNNLGKYANTEDDDNDWLKTKNIICINPSTNGGCGLPDQQQPRLVEQCLPQV